MVGIHMLIITYLIFMFNYHIHRGCSVATAHTAMPHYAYPLSSKQLAEYQQKDVTLMQHLQCHAEYFSKAIEGKDLVLFHQCIYVPKPLLLQVLEWYHGMLCHPGMKKMERTICQQLVWPGLSNHRELYQDMSSMPDCKYP